MRTYDLSPLFRSSVGFDRVMRVVDDALRGEDRAPGYPPYNIEQTGEDAYRISMAVAGFTGDELSIETRENAVTITGEKKPNGEGKYLYRGIAQRGFNRTFRLADYVQVTGASLDNGLLHVELKRELPEAVKPRKIAVTTGAAPVADKAKGLLGGAKKAA
jgi:molecular chaperone IbpA